MSLALLQAFGGGHSTPPPPNGGGGDPGSPEAGLPWAGTTIAGVGSPSTSLVDYPPIPNGTDGDWYVDRSVASSGDGTTPQTAFKTLSEGLAALSNGQTLRVRGGTYTFSSRIYRSSAWSTETRVMAYGDERPVLDFTGASISTGSGAVHFSGATRETWHRFYIKNVPWRGMYSTGAQYLKWSDIWASHTGQASGSTGENCDGFLFRNSDVGNIGQDLITWHLGNGSATLSSNLPDGFIISYGATGCKWVRCLAANSMDDGYDFWDSNGNEAIDSIAYGVGRYWNGVWEPDLQKGGEGNGFKLGGGGSSGNGIKGCLSMFNRKNGMQNNGSPDSVIHSVTFYGNGNNGVRCDQSSDSTAELRDCTSHESDGSTFSIGSQNPDDQYCSWNSSALAGGNPAFPLTTAEMAYLNAAGFDLSLGGGSLGINAGFQGNTIGASNIALRIAKYWIPHLISIGEAD